MLPSREDTGKLALSYPTTAASHRSDRTHLNGALCYSNVYTYFHTWEDKSLLGKGIHVMTMTDENPQVELA